MLGRFLHAIAYSTACISMLIIFIGIVLYGSTFVANRIVIDLSEMISPRSTEADELFTTVTALKIPMITNILSQSAIVDWRVNSELMISGPGISTEEAYHQWGDIPQLEVPITDLGSTPPVYLFLRLSNEARADTLVDALVTQGLSAYYVSNGASQFDVFAGPVNNLNPESSLMRYLLSIGFH